MHPGEICPAICTNQRDISIHTHTVYMYVYTKRERERKDGKVMPLITCV